MSAAALLRRLGKVENTIYDDTGQRRGGCMKVPPIMSLDDWERIAIPQQVALAHACREDLPMPTLSTALPTAPRPPITTR